MQLSWSFVPSLLVVALAIFQPTMQVVAGHEDDIAATTTTTTTTTTSNAVAVAGAGASAHHDEDNTITRRLRGGGSGDGGQLEGDDHHDEDRHRELFSQYFGHAIRNRATQTCIDVTWATTKDGLDLQLVGCQIGNYWPAQRWQAPNGGTTGHIKTYQMNGNAFTGNYISYCMDPEGPSSAAGTKIQIWQCQNGYSFHDWELQASNYATTFKLKNTNMCMTAMGHGNYQGITLQPCVNGNNYQIWEMIR